jgi:hypothetical protein
VPDGAEAVPGAGRVRVSRWPPRFAALIEGSAGGSLHAQCLYRLSRLCFCFRSVGALRNAWGEAAGDDVIAPARAGSEDAVVAHEVEARRRDGEGEPLQERHRLEHDLRGAVSPAPLEPVAEATVVEPREPIGGERRAGDVPAEPLETTAVAGRNGDGGMEAEAGTVRAARLGPGVTGADLVGLDPIPEAEQALARSGPCGDAAL